ncbi:NAD(P)-binding domain-containing protein [Microscilla marina]|uniref:Secreted protein n=1 Tax=Microscilla marina ATCC 23134 TaxID=313606 RepID=A1ZV00_MICM2|nr:NAD(P)-binding domain-containing protein [Microscilla marina]EAY25778.1 secreted protein [Microscilla marina ATCC 23134]
MEHYSTLPTAIIGGGPVGLAAAAHLFLANQPFILFETGKSVGHNLLDWGHVRVFSPWQYNIDKAARALLQQSVWQAPDDKGLPLGAEIVHNYLQPLANLPQIKPHIHLNSQVIQVGRKGLDKMTTKNREQCPFVLRVKQGDVYQRYEAKAVIDVSGTWQNPNPIGSGGVSALNEENCQQHIFYGIPDVLGIHRERFANKSVAVVGGGHSAINSLLDLNKLRAAFPATQLHWVLRKKDMAEAYGGKENDGLRARGALGKRIEKLVEAKKVHIHTPFHIDEIMWQGAPPFTIKDVAGNTLEGIQEIVANTGARPDFSFLREIRYAHNSALESVPALANLIDPNIHSCGTVRPHGERELRQPEKDFYIAGAKSYGRAPTFLMATGYEQVRSIVAAIAGNWQAAKEVKLELPETGVCSTELPSAPAPVTTCCGIGQEQPATLSKKC